MYATALMTGIKTNMNEKKTAIIYARVSSAKQADEGISMESQIEQGQRKANELGASVLQVFRDEGVSGRTDRRPSFQRAISYCDDHKIDYFICWSTSRFARNKLDAASYKKILSQSGTKVVYVSVNIDSDTDEGWFSEAIFEIMDEHLSRQISKDTRRSMIKNAHDGYWNGGRVPFGYSVVEDGKRKRLAICDVEAVIVRDVFNAYVSGEGCKSITVSLNSKGITNRGKIWNKSQIIRMLKNPIYTGVLVFNRVRADGTENPESEWIMTKSHDNIISKEQFERVRELFQSKTTQTPNIPQSNQVFSGIFRCGTCGEPMQTETATGRSGKRYHYYNCSTFLKTGGCQSRRVSAEEFDQWMLDQVVDKILTKDMVLDFMTELSEITGQYRKDYDDRAKALSIELKKNKQEADKILAVIGKMGNQAPGLSTLLERLEVLQNAKKHIEQTLLGLESIKVSESAQFTEAQVNDAFDILKDTIIQSDNNKKTRALMGNILESIVLNSDMVSINYQPERIFNKKNRIAGANAVLSSERWLPDLDSNQGPAD